MFHGPSLTLPSKFKLFLHCPLILFWTNFKNKNLYTFIIEKKGRFINSKENYPKKPWFALLFFSIKIGYMRVKTCYKIFRAQNYTHPKQEFYREILITTPCNLCAGNL
ncbi:hypothetical protein CVU75_01385 [Candidatus Dependentiae bacterium HGW-Dependentiae-1]|nr:MAG: hypothetical protein CVU75_01385 [Candidatus Dependentiae bacterium HGW-Dependentiae-1]